MDSDSDHPPSPFLVISLLLLTLCRGALGSRITIVNGCAYTVWPGILSNAGSPALGSTGFELPPGQFQSFDAPSGWSGRFWGRTGCTFDPSTNQGACSTGDCGSGQLECGGSGATPPATLAEFTFGVASSDSKDFYDVSLVDGYNLPMVVQPSGGVGTCLSTGCISDLNRKCPSELRVGSGDGCRSACEAFGTPEYCCSGAYGSPDTCKPSVYSQMFKEMCPRSYSYAYDDATSTFTCSQSDYTITFCPSVSSSLKSATGAGAGSNAGEPDTGTTPAHKEDGRPSWLSNLFLGNSGAAASAGASTVGLIICINMLRILELFL
ncbi:hypothetical protein MLD38_002138 [Melastoma candidum]|uniref:Uncharacterized protein n=1 Tax=Melastoma candidum TaxID=119954 RepID=A0ACB9SFW8_9MYRT|nr:hypothetical protein MLD38_002138 [Melastoma candidum]